MSEDEALDHLKKMLAESHPELAWFDVQSKYQMSVEAEDADIRAQMALEKEEDEDTKDAEGDDQENMLGDSGGDVQVEVAQSDELVSNNNITNANGASDLPRSSQVFPIFISLPLVVHGLAL